MFFKKTIEIKTKNIKSTSNIKHQTSNIKKCFMHYNISTSMNINEFWSFNVNINNNKQKHQHQIHFSVSSKHQHQIVSLFTQNINIKTAWHQHHYAPIRREKNMRFWKKTLFIIFFELPKNSQFFFNVFFFWKISIIIFYQKFWKSEKKSWIFFQFLFFFFENYVLQLFFNFF